MMPGLLILCTYRSACFLSGLNHVMVHLGVRSRTIQNRSRCNESRTNQCAFVYPFLEVEMERHTRCVADSCHAARQIGSKFHFVPHMYVHVDHAFVIHSW